MGVVVKVVKEPVEKKILLLDRDFEAGEVIYTVSTLSRFNPPIQQLFIVPHHSL